MSAAAKEALGQARRMIPPLLPHFHKGQLGRVAVIGGSKDYTGAPYFSAIASAKLGCDMSHVICTPAAAAVIKTYSPNLMVHPLMHESPADGPATSTPLSSATAPIIDLLPRLHVLVLGPGLGRDVLMQATVREVIQAARNYRIPLVIDADALLAVEANPELVQGYPLAVLTPNVREFSRLCVELGVKGPDGKEPGARDLARALDGPVVVQKGREDLVCVRTAEGVRVDIRGAPKRSGGQGDTLTGAIATMLAWRRGYIEGLWGDSSGKNAEDSETMLAAAVAGAFMHVFDWNDEGEADEEQEK
ncbi:ATP-dependent (S)-NAD(P)H-hydrate dehydratase [Ceratocystis platani]|uniref:ATP-dependent (S)-NAD(P)H-hydrate dehydratase n=1 Tax=Ceratocystis fimbriata f. sp. platani TaxID=88771 RepID=A0A0F8B8Y1_CERFI|nr:ATP-dependent (S)-NAD(P)H-hydrate dehydratase [Ceratocystis platani]